MKILILPSWYPTELNKLNGIFCQEQAKALSKKDSISVLYIEFVSFKNIFKSKLFNLSYSKIENINTYVYSIPSFGIYRFGFADYIYLFIYKKVLKKVLKKIGSIDIIHAHTTYCAGYAATKLKNYFKIPVVVTEHFSKVAIKKINFLQKNHLRYTVKNADRFICVSQFLKNKIKEYGISTKNVIVIPNIINNRFKYQKRNVIHKNFIFCSVSSLIDRKKVDLLIDAFNSGFNHMKNAKLYIAGYGKNYYILKNKILKYKLSNNVFLLGALDRNDIYKLYCNSDAFIMVSNCETFGIVYIEAMACGLPSIGTKNGGANEILLNYGGLLCKVNDVNDISKKMLFLYNNCNKFNRKKISQNICKNYSEKIIISRLKTVYFNCL